MLTFRNYIKDHYIARVKQWLESMDPTALYQNSFYNEECFKEVLMYIVIWKLASEMAEF